MDVDRALESLGVWSRWRMISYFLSSLFCGFMAGWHMLGIVFVGMMPDYLCKLPNGVSTNSAIPLIMKEGKQVLDSCNVWVNYTQDTNQTTSCPDGYEFSNPHLHTIVHEWLLLCDRSYLIETSQTVLVVGVMVGALVCATLADKIGRKTVFLGAVFASGLIGFITAWVQHPIAFMVMRFVTGFFQQGIVIGGFVFICELFPASQRTVWGQLMQIAWAIGMAVMALMAWQITNWRHFLIAISLPAFLALPLVWFLSESIPWLVAKKQILEAKIVLHKAVRISKRNVRVLPREFQLTEADRAEIQEMNAKNGIKEKMENVFRVCCQKEDGSDEKVMDAASNYSIIDIFKSRKLLTYALIMCYLWCVNSLVYYGLSLSTGSLAGDPYINFMSSGFVEIPAYIIAAFALQTIGRRWSIFAFHMVAGVPLFLTLFVPEKTSNGTNLQPLIVTLAMIGKFGITGSFGSIFLYAPELFPTTVRSVGIGIASVGGRVGNIVAPFSSLVARKVWWLPNVVFGVLAILGAVLTLLLPETLNRPLPQTIEDVESWSRSLSKAEKKRLKEEKQRMKEMNALNIDEPPIQETLQPLQDKSG